MPVLVVGEHMDHLVSEIIAYYHEERPHQAKDNNPLLPDAPVAARRKSKRRRDEPPPDVPSLSQIHCRKRLGGLLRHYYRKAA